MNDKDLMPLEKGLEKGLEKKEKEKKNHFLIFRNSNKEI